MDPVTSAANNSAVRVVGRIFDAIEGALRRQWAAYKNQSENVLAEYLERTSARLSRVMNLAFSTKPASLPDLYVETRFFGQTRKPVSENEILPSTLVNRRMLIIGKAGAGKSFFAKHTFLRMINESGSCFPLFIECRHLNSRWQSQAPGDISLPSLQSIIWTMLGMSQRNIIYEQIEEGFKNGLFTIIFDGLDELSPRLYSFIVEQIRHISAIFPSLSIIVTSRPLVRAPRWDAFEILEITPFEYDQAELMISKIPASREIKTNFLSLVSPEYFEENKAVIARPLMLLILFLTYRRAGRLSQEVAVFYEDAYNALYNTHDATKEAFQRERQSGLSYLPFRRAVNALAAITFYESAVQMNQFSILRYSETAGKISGVQLSPESFVNELVVDLGLIFEEGGSYEFVHRSFQEFLASHFFLSLPTEKAISAITKALSKPGSENLLYLIWCIDQDFCEEEILIPSLKAFLSPYESFGLSVDPISYFMDQMEEGDSEQFSSIKFLPRWPAIMAYRQMLTSDGSLAIRSASEISNLLFEIETGAKELLARLQKRKMEVTISGTNSLKGYKGNDSKGQPISISRSALMDALRQTLSPQTIQFMSTCIANDLRVLEERYQEMVARHTKLGRVVDDIFELEKKGF